MVKTSSPFFKGIVQMPTRSYRRWYGFALGTAVGLAYGLFSQSINHLLLPGVPVYQPLFGFWGNTLLSVVIGALLGTITAWHAISLWGIVWGSVAGALIILGVSLITGSTDAESLWVKALMLAMLLLPVVGACAIGLLAFRWVVDRELYMRPDHGFASLRRVLLPGLLITVALAAGSFSAYPPVGRTVTRRMNEMIQTGRQAASREALPAPLQGREVLHFMEYCGAGYSLEWSLDEKNDYRVARPVTKPYEPTTVAARFKNGYLLVCVYSNESATPACKDFLPPGENSRLVWQNGMN